MNTLGLDRTRGTRLYVRVSVALFLCVDEIDVGMFEVPGTIFIYARTDKPWRPTAGEWEGFVCAVLPAHVCAHLFLLPTNAAPEFGDELARRVYAAATGRGFTTDAERAA